MDPVSNAQLLTAIGTMLLAVGTFLLALVAVFQQGIWARLRRPILSISASVVPPDSHKTRLRAGAYGTGAPEADCYYLRLKVTNSGNAPATMVELSAAELRRLEDDGSWTRIDRFLPLSLKWSHIGSPTMPFIHRGTEKLCDLGHIVDPKMRRHFPVDQLPSDLVTRDPSLSEKTALSLDTEVAPLTFSHIIPPGKYRIALVLAAAECQPVRRTLEIGINGVWHDTELIMLGTLVTMKLVD